jgi:hypothetical protein
MNNTTKRPSALGDLSDLAPRERPAVPREVVDQVAKDAGFPSRQAPAEAPPKREQRRRRTARSEQFNIKARQADIDRFYAMADAADVTLGELLKRALDALETEQGGK